MKIIKILSYSFTVAALAFVMGCGKCDTCTDHSTPAQPDAPAAGDLSDAAAKAAGQVKAAAEQASGKAQDLINQAKSLVDAKKYTDASNILQQLASLKLTPEQQKLVDDLKATIQQSLANQGTSKATEAVGGILGGKK